MSIPRLSFDPKISAGTVLSALMGLFALLGVYVTQERKNEQFQGAIATILRDIAQIRADVALTNSRADERSRVYGPRVEALSKSQDVQDERIGNLIESVKATRDANNETRKLTMEVAARLGDIREDLAGIRAKLGIGRGQAVER